MNNLLDKESLCASADATFRSAEPSLVTNQCSLADITSYVSLSLSKEMLSGVDFEQAFALGVC